MGLLPVAPAGPDGPALDLRSDPQPTRPADHASRIPVGMDRVKVVGFELAVVLLYCMELVLVLYDRNPCIPSPLLTLPNYGFLGWKQSIFIAYDTLSSHHAIHCQTQTIAVGTGRSTIPEPVLLQP